MTIDLPAILNSLPRLDAAALQAIRERTGALLSLSGKHTTSNGVLVHAPTETSRSDYIFDGIQHELRRRCLIGTTACLPRQVLPDDYEEQSLTVRAHLGEQYPKLSSVERAALGQLAARCLADHLEYRHIPVMVSTMLKRVHEIPDAIEASYPSYLRHRKLHTVWKSVA